MCKINSKAHCKVFLPCECESEVYIMYKGHLRSDKGQPLKSRSKSNLIHTLCTTVELSQNIHW